MRRVLLACLLAVEVSAASAQVIHTDGWFSRYYGDVTPQAFPLVTAVNGVLVPPNASDTYVADDGSVIVRGSLVLPNPTSVEFKDGQIQADGSTFFLTPSLIAWTPSDTPITADPFSTPFKLGTLTLTNGIFLANATFDVTFTTRSSNPDWDGHSFSDVIHYVVTPNLVPSSNNPFDVVFTVSYGASNCPRAPAILDIDTCNADYVFLEGHPNLQVLGPGGSPVASPRPGPIVYEGVQYDTSFGNTGTVELWGMLGSLDPAYYANADGGVGLPVVTAAVPEPPEWALLLGGTWAVAAVVGRRRKGGR